MDRSREKPAHSGLYWYREGDPPIYKHKILEISGPPADPRVKDYGAPGELRRLRQYNGEWYGPLQPPS
jgi:hypothetical protein